MSYSYSLTMLFWEFRVIVSFVIINIMFADIIREMIRRTTELYLGLYCHPCYVEIESADLSIIHGTFTLKNSKICLPERLMKAGWKEKVIAKAGTISASCHPIRYSSHHITSLHITALYIIYSIYYYHCFSFAFYFYYL